MIEETSNEPLHSGEEIVYETATENFNKTVDTTDAACLPLTGMP